ncbi:hypothetical protein AOL_s00215g85 [Orbilia oligospora ATCC 24927]|uniref:Cadmium resistance transporter n=1 Tax=Arthrobotrys oligospora (strain ATCC 24927 / CBS 115.81 / DSM 1491) TaxID=756982 RepID=G1XTF6_ARTOA|nr:hypothetical protein AOL_s00215g85 [Orbilia oligospora ATCC 24927]EGX43349.1 hypothetical protein AOL_s00215g85 [Orbilia oligospora ATCC 24927]
MQFGKVLGTACSTFAITNIDDLFVLATFFTESSVNKNLTPLKIAIGQYVGFSVIIVISMIGFAVAQAIPSEPIGFLGLLPILLGVWKLLGLIFPSDLEEEEEQTENVKTAGMKCIFKVASITVMNGGDNIGTYVPLFSQAEGAEIAVYVVTYYILLGIWCLIAFLIIKQRHILLIAQKYAGVVVPLLYVGLGIFIVIKSHCYPWSIQNINEGFLGNPGKAILATMTTFLLSSCITTMLWIRLRKRSAGRRTMADTDMELQSMDPISEAVNSKSGTYGSGAGVAGTAEENTGSSYRDVVPAVESISKSRDI